MTQKRRPAAPDEIAINPENGIPLAQQIRTQYARLITSGQLPAGTFLPSVRELADRLQINVNTVRASYQRLATDGLVMTSHGLGSRVLPLDASRLLRLAGSEKTNTVGVIVPHIGNPFYSDFVRGVEGVAQTGRAMLVVFSTHDQPDQLWRAFAQLSAHHVDGIIAASCNLCELLSQPEAHSVGLPVVTADWPDCTGPSVEMDLENAGYQATRHLIEHGHRRIGLITESLYAANIRPVNQGYARALKAARIAPEPDWIARVDGFSLEAGRLAAEALLRARHRPSAIFAIADILALGVMEAIRAAGLRIPADIALTSFNNIEFAALVTPALTTVRAPAHDLGREAMKMLSTLMEGKQPRRKRVRLPTTLIVRESCGPHKAAQT